MSTTPYDLIVIGGGPAGYVGAIRAAQLGKRVAVVEKERAGGTCLNWGCIPTKALLKNAELYSLIGHHAADFGLEVSGLKYDWDKVIGRSRKVADKLAGGIEFLFKKNKVDYIKGDASVPKAGVVEVKGTDGKEQTLTAAKILIATGVVTREMPGFAFNGTSVIGSRHALALAKQPKELIVIGAGAIGIEFAYFYNAFGTKVTVVEMQDRILPVEDDDISAAALKSFTAQGIQFRLGQVTKAIDTHGKGASVTIVDAKDEKKSEKLEAEVVLVAIGVQGRTDGLFDPSLGIRMEKGHIWTDYKDKPRPTYQTSVPGIFAIGDVIGPPWLAHVASEEAVACVERMKGHDVPGVNYAAIPGCTYCNPQVASVGMTERDAKAKGIQYKVGKYPFKAHGKAIAVGATEGLVKIIVGQYGEIIGGHIFGTDASELIGEICLGIAMEGLAEDIIHTVHAHPTMHEAIHEAALATEGRVIHG
jgi:dihydrolipoamide dehydrogenase